MLKHGWRCLLGMTLVWMTTGCMWVGVHTAVSVTTVQPAYSAVSAPAVTLNFKGQSVPGEMVEFSWFDPQNSNSSAGQTGLTWPPKLPALLHAQVGQTISLTTNFSVPPEAWWITEYDRQGAIMASTVVSPNTTYPLTQPGRWVLYVRGQWDYRRYVAYYFDLEVAP